MALLNGRTDDGLAAITDRVHRERRRSLCISIEVTDKLAVQEAISENEKELGNLSIALNAAGIAHASLISGIPLLE